METYYFTFGQMHRCPITWTSLKDYYVKVVAENYNEARFIMVTKYGDKWAFQYAEKDFDKSYYSGAWEQLVSQKLIKEEGILHHNKVMSKIRNDIWNYIPISSLEVDQRFNYVSKDAICKCGHKVSHHTVSIPALFFYEMELRELCDGTLGKT